MEKVIDCLDQSQNTLEQVDNPNELYLGLNEVPKLNNQSISVSNILSCIKLKVFLPYPNIYLMFNI